MLSQSLLHIRVFGDQDLYLTLKDLQLPQDNLITITKEFVIELVGVQFLAHAFYHHHCYCQGSFPLYIQHLDHIPNLNHMYRPCIHWIDLN